MPSGSDRTQISVGWRKAGRPGRTSLADLKTDLARLTPRLIPYYGTKAAFIHRYPPPQHSTIVEPFAGAASYSLVYAERDVMLVEKWPLLAALWRFLIRVTPEEVRRLPLATHADELGHLPEEARWLIRWWFDPATTAPSAAQPCKRSRDKSVKGMTAPRSFWGAERRALIAREVERIKHWRIIEGDYALAPQDQATWFIDPPYEVAGKSYKCSSTDIDFAHLGKWSRSREGQVIVCENTRAGWLPFKPLALTRGSARAARAENHEAIWTNDKEHA